MQLRSKHLVDDKLLSYIEKSNKLIAQSYKDHPHLKQFTYPDITSSEVVETILRLGIATDDRMDAESNYNVPELLYVLACIDLEESYIRHNTDGVLKHGKIDAGFMDILDVVQPGPRKFVMRSNPVEMCAIQQLSDLSEFTTYKFSNNSMIPRVA
jgi:hypothetical protein